MKSFPYLLAATLLLSTSSLIAMDPNDRDTLRRNIQRQREEIQKSLEKQRKEFQQSHTKSLQEYQQDLDKARQELLQARGKPEELKLASLKYLQANDKAVEENFQSFNQKPLQFGPYKPVEAKPYEPLKFGPYEPIKVVPYKPFEAKPYEASKPNGSSKYNQANVENDLNETRLLLENRLIFSQDIDEQRLLNDQLETVNSRLFVSRNFELSDSDQDAFSLQARQQLEEVRAYMIQLQRTRAEAQQQKQKSPVLELKEPVPDLKQSVSVPSIKQEFPILTIKHYIEDICMGENPFDDEGWEMDESTHSKFVVQIQGKNLNDYAFIGIKNSDGIVEYRLTSKSDISQKLEVPLKFKKKVSVAPVSPQKAAPASPQQKLESNNFIGQLKERLNSSKNQEKIEKAPAAFAKFDQPKPVQQNDNPKPFAQLRPIEKRNIEMKPTVPATAPQFARPLPQSRPLAQQVAPVVQPAREAPAKKWTVNTPPQLK